MKNNKYINIGISFIICLLYIIFANYYSFPWCDEVYFSNPASNFIKGGEWYTVGIGNPYPPLYSLILAGWFVVFGISHMAAVSLEICIAFIVYVVLFNIIERRSLFENHISYYYLLPLFWLGFYFPTAFTMGRVDMLVLLILLLFVDEVVPEKEHLVFNGWKIFSLSFLLSFSAIYPLPFVVYVLLFLFVLYWKEYRKKYIKIGFIVFIGFSLGLLATIIFSYLNNYLLAFISWIGIGNTQGSTFADKLIHAYSDIPTLVLFFVVLIITVFRKQSKLPKTVLIFVVIIPLLMMLVGRFERYYWWMMYIPVIVLFISSVEILSKMKALITISVISILCISSQLLLINYPDRYSHDYFSTNYSKDIEIYKENTNLAESMVRENMSLIDEYNNAAFVSEQFYYPLVETDANCWFIFNASFPETLKVEFVSHDRTKFYWRIYDDYVRGEPKESFPQKGIFFSLENLHSDKCISFLEREQYNYSVSNVESYPEAKIITFEK